MISVKNLRKSYGKQLAVDDLSLDIQRGETIGLLGPNGAGKSTTICMLVGLLKPDSGSIKIGDGKNGSSGTTRFNPIYPDVRRLIGVAPQSLSIYEELSTLENLRFFGGLYSLSGNELTERVDWALNFSGLDDRKNDRVTTFSGGMKRRLNIAVALLHKPDILLLDEPTVGVDPQSRNHIFEIINGLQQDGMTILYTTHYMEEAQRLCDRVAIIDHGKLLDLGTVDELISRHGGDSVVTATLTGSLDSVDLPGELTGNELRFESSSPLDEVMVLKNKLEDQNITFQSLLISRPDLENVFLTLTGRSLRD